MGDFRSGSLAGNVGSEGTNPNSDPNGAAHYTTDHNAWLEFGGFFINIVNSNGTGSAFWSTANPGGSTGGGGGTQIVPHITPDLTHNQWGAAMIVGGCTAYLVSQVITDGVTLPVTLNVAGACAMAMGSDWDNIATGLSQLFDSITSWSGQQSNNDVATSYFADYLNTEVQGSTATGSETINTPDGSTYSGNDTGGFGESDSFKDLNAGPPIVVYYGDLPFVSHHSESPIISHL
jgi:hypothetical protein